MICPVKICRQEIPDDSFYCDQCGIRILHCPKCGHVDVTPRCRKCGGTMVFKDAEPPAKLPAETNRPPSTPAVSPVDPETAVSSATVVIPPVNKKLLFCHADGWNLEITGGDVLGRINGNHSARLGAFPVISSNHAKITFENDGWHITDLKSTNKTWVNNTQVQPGVSCRIKSDDVVQLANISFVVREP